MARTLTKSSQLLTKTITYSALTTGAVGTTTLFTVSGTVSLNVFALCTTDLAGAGTIEVGTASSTAALCNQQNATAIDNHDVWHNSSLAIGANVAAHEHIVNESIIQTIGTDTVSGGVLTFYCTWEPLSDGSSVTVA